MFKQTGYQPGWGGSGSAQPQLAMPNGYQKCQRSEMFVPSLNQRSASEQDVSRPGGARPTRRRPREVARGLSRRPDLLALSAADPPITPD